MFNNFFTENQFYQLPGLLLWKNLDSSYKISNLNAARLLGFSEVDELIGMMDYDIPCEAAINADTWIAQDQEVIKKKEKIHAIDIHTYFRNETKVIFYEKAPVVIDNEVVAVQCVSHEMNQSFFHTIYENLLREKKVLNSYRIVERFTEFDLTIRESECLYFFMRGKSSSFIGKVLHLSSRTVESHTDRIKHKMACHNKPEFVEKAINLNLNLYILRSLFDKQIV